MWERVKKYLGEVRKGNKKISRDAMLILFLCGILLYVITLPTKNNNNSYYKKKQQNTVALEETQGTQEQESEQEYCKDLERKLEEFLSHVEGVGKVKVLIYMNVSKTYVVEKDSPVYEASRSSGQENSTENKMEETTVYTTNDYGEQVPFISRTQMPRIEGIVIAAQGAANENVRIQLIRMAMALYGVEANKVDVMILNEN